MVDAGHLESRGSADFVRTATLIYLLCFGLRFIDVFVVRSDEWFGEQVLTKVLGLAIVVTYAIWSGFSLTRIGFRKTSTASAIGIGIGFTALVMSATFLIQFLLLTAQGDVPKFTIDIQGFALGQQADDQNDLVSSIGLLTSNLVNALMEESLFRGLLITHLVVAMSSMRANVIQSILFGVWHIVWPLRAFHDGDMTFGAAMSYGAGYTLVATMMGFVWGCFFIWFRSLWVSILAHTFHNTAFNAFHITTATGTSGVAFFTTVEALVFLALLPVVRRFRR